MDDTVNLLEEIPANLVVRILLMYKSMGIAVIVGISLIVTIVLSKIIGCSDHNHRGGYLFHTGVF